MSESKKQSKPHGSCFYCGRSAQLLARQGFRIFSSPLAMSQILHRPILDIVRIVLKELNVVVPGLDRELPGKVKKGILNMNPLFVCEECLQALGMVRKNLQKAEQRKVPYPRKPLDDQGIKLHPEEARQIRDPESDINRLLAEIVTRHDLGEDEAADGVGR